MIFWPVTTATIEVLSAEVKNEIARRVAEKVYHELRNENYLESSYILEIAEKIAKKAFDLSLVRFPNSDGTAFRIQKHGGGDEPQETLKNSR